MVRALVATACLLAASPALAQESRLWLEIDVHQLGAEHIRVQAPYDWLDHGVLSAALLGEVEALSIDWRTVADALHEIGDSERFFLVDEDQRIDLTLERRVVPAGQRARRLVVESAGPDGVRMEVPIAAARWFMALAGQNNDATSELGQFVQLEPALKRMARLEPFTFLVASGAGADLTVTTH